MAPAYLDIEETSDGFRSGAEEADDESDEESPVPDEPVRERWPGSEADGATTQASPSDGLRSRMPFASVDGLYQRRSEPPAARPKVDFDELGRRMCGEEEGEPMPDAMEVPSVEQMLRQLEEEAARDTADRALQHCVPVLLLNHPAELDSLVNRLDDLESMTSSQLRAEYESRGFVTPDDATSRGELLPLARDAVISQALNAETLLEKCKKAGVVGAHEGLSCEELYSLLAQPTWRQYGIHREHFQDLETARAALDLIRSLETQGRSELRALCRQYRMPTAGLPVSMLVDQLRKAIVWEHLSEEPLLAELAELKLERPDPSLAEQLGCTRKQAIIKRLVCSQWGDYAQQFERMELTEAFLERFERVDSLPGPTSIKAEIERLGLHAHGGIGEAEQCDILRRSFILQQIAETARASGNMSELRRECDAMGVKVDDEDSVDELLRRLLQQSCMASWRKAKAPLPTASSDYERVERILVEWQAIDVMTLSDLKKWYKTLGFPEESDAQRPELADLAYKVGAWQESSFSDLEEECLRQGIELPEQDEKADDQLRRQVLVDALTCRNRMDSWDRRGFEASRMHCYQTAVQIVELFDNYQAQSTEELMRILREQGLPNEAMKDRAKVLATLKTLLVWELLPLEELRKDCKARGLPLSVDSETPEEAHSELYRRLRVDMNVKMSRTVYEEKGIPVDRLTSLGAANVLAQYESVEKQTTEELMEWYTGNGFPREAAMQRDELVKIAKHLAVWTELPLDDLRAECAKKEVQIKEPLEGDEAAQRQHIVDQLLFHERMEAWEARGYRCKALGDIDKSGEVVIQCEKWQSMGHVALKKAFADGGYIDNKGAGHDVLVRLERPELLKALKAVLIWELLPEPELRQDCKQKGMNFLEGHAREECIRWLVRSTFANTWAARGIPAERLGSLEVAEELIKELDRLEASVTYHEMIGEGTKPLKEAFKKLSLPFDPRLDNQALIDRLRDVSVWSRLPIAELQRECRAHGVPHEVEGLRAATSTIRSAVTQGLGLAPPTSLSQPPGALAGHRALRPGELGRSKGGGKIIGTMPRTRDVLNGGKGSRLVSGLGTGRLVGDKLTAFAARAADHGIAGAAKSVKASETLGRMAQTKEAKEEVEKARRVLIERLVLATWRSTWKPRGIPADRMSDLREAAALIEEVDRVEGLTMEGVRAELSMMRVVGGENCTLEMLVGRLRSLVIWQFLPEAELRRECRSLGHEDKDYGMLDRGQMMEELLQHYILGESEAEGIPVYKMKNQRQAFESMECIDASSLEYLKDWYEKTLNLPPERCIERKELVRLAKLVTCWQDLSDSDLWQQCQLNKINVGKEGEANSQQLADALLSTERTRTWDSRGFEATRLGGIDKIYQLIGQYEGFDAMSDEELVGAFESIGIPNYVRGDRAEKLRILKMLLVWEHLPLEEIKKECENKKLPLQQALQEHQGDSEEAQQELYSSLIAMLQADMRAEANKDALEQKGISVARFGSVTAVKIDLAIAQMESRSTEELRTEYAEMGFNSEDQALDRQHILDILKQSLLWQYMPVTELQKECLDRDVPLHVDLDPSDEAECDCDVSPTLSSKPNRKHSELLKRLHIDLSVKENKREYIRQGIPTTRLNSQKAWSIMLRFDEIEGYDIDTLRKAQQDALLPPAPNLTKEDLVARLKDVAIWKELGVEELQRECDLRNVKVFHHSATAGTPKPSTRELLLDALLLHRGARTYDDIGVPYRTIKTANGAVNTMIAWDDIIGMDSSSLKVRYTGLGLSANRLELEEIRHRLKMVAVYLEIPAEDLRNLCGAHGISLGHSNLSRSEMVQRLVKTLWPPRADPPQPKPKPRPHSYYPPPPPKPPPGASAAAGRLRLASYFQVLQLPPSAGIDEVKKAYRRMALKHHPDKNRGEHDQKAVFQKVAEAYEKLSEFFLDHTK